MDGGGCACVRACVGAALEEMARGRDIFGKVKDLRVGQMQGEAKREGAGLCGVNWLKGCRGRGRLPLGARRCQMLLSWSDYLHIRFLCPHITKSGRTQGHTFWQAGRSFAPSASPVPSSTHPGKVAMYFRRCSKKKKNAPAHSSPACPFLVSFWISVKVKFLDTSAWQHTKILVLCCSTGKMSHSIA